MEKILATWGPPSSPALYVKTKLRRTHPFRLRDPAVVVDVCDVREGVPDLLEEGLGDLVLVAVDLPAAHPAYLVLGPQEVVVRQAPVVVQV